MSGATTAYAILFLAILCEVIGTSALKASEEFTRPVPTVIMAFSYGTAFYLLTIVMRSIPMGIAYALWSGIGIVLISVVGLAVFKQRLDVPACIGIGLIVAGVIIINTFSKSSAH